MPINFDELDDFALGAAEAIARYRLEFKAELQKARPSDDHVPWRGVARWPP